MGDARELDRMRACAAGLSEVIAACLALEYSRAGEIEALTRQVHHTLRRSSDAESARMHAGASARNLLHYLALRQFDLRPLQDDLARLGLSTMGGCEAAVLESVLAIQRAVHSLLGESAPQHAYDPASILTRDQARVIVQARSARLFGQSVVGKDARSGAAIMVTLPSHASRDGELVRELVAGGMDVARINTAHDDAQVWEKMIDHVQQACAHTGRSCSIMMDLAGPKLRTGAMEPGPAVICVRPVRDAYGRVLAAGALVLTDRVYAQEEGQLAAWESRDDAAEASPLRGRGSLDRAVRAVVRGSWLRERRVGEVITVVDTRGRFRELTVEKIGPLIDAAIPLPTEPQAQSHVQSQGLYVLLRAQQATYLTNGSELIAEVEAHTGHDAPAAAPSIGLISEIPSSPGAILVTEGDRVRLMRQERARTNAEPQTTGGTLGRGATPSEQAQGLAAVIWCTLPEALEAVEVGHMIWLDDGKLGLRVQQVTTAWIDLVVAVAGPLGEKIREDKGINLPSTPVRIAGLSRHDEAILPLLAHRAHAAGMSFVQDPTEVRGLIDRLTTLRRSAATDRSSPPRSQTGIVLKIETHMGFERLPELLLAALESDAPGVMIARGDLAVELGYERMAEVQEEMLWLCEAAHVPVIWATQVLESMVKKGRPSRAEMTDAAMAQRAECVMLNKGPFVVEAAKLLQRLGSRMRGHLEKKRPALRSLSIARRFVQSS